MVAGPQARHQDEQRIKALAVTIIRALQAGSGRSTRCAPVDELCSRLAEDGVIYDAAAYRLRWPCWRQTVTGRDRYPAGER
jgi:hypothetical protein